jgi:hypothetical protein
MNTPTPATFTQVEAAAKAALAERRERHPLDSRAFAARGPRRPIWDRPEADEALRQGREEERRAA